jgi:hypothetical protein
MNGSSSKRNLLDFSNVLFLLRKRYNCRYILPFVVFSLSACSVKTFAPTALGAVGGGVGALGGPATAFAGAGLGAAAGQIIKESDAVIKKTEELQALGEGDVAKLIELKLKEERGFFQKLIDGIYDILMISAVGMALYFIFHYWRVRTVAKKVNNLEKNNNHD